MMILRTITLIIVFILFATTLLNSDTHSKREEEKVRKLLQYGNFGEIKIFSNVYVYFEGDDAKRIGLNKDELTDYARLKVKNNFANIKIAENWKQWHDKYEEDQVGVISFRVWVLGNDFPIAYHIIGEMKTLALGVVNEKNKEVLGVATKDSVRNNVKKFISDTVESFAIGFYKVRGEL